MQFNNYLTIVLISLFVPPTERVALPSPPPIVEPIHYFGLSYMKI